MESRVRKYKNVANTLRAQLSTVEVARAELDMLLRTSKREERRLRMENERLAKQMSQFQNSYGCLLEQNILSDVILKIEEMEVPAHRFVLSARSSVFKAMFNGNMKESITDVVPLEGTILAFRCLLRYIYTLETEITGEVVMELLYLAQKYGFQELVGSCCAFVEENLSAENACTLLIEADHFNKMELKKKCADKILSNLEVVVELDDFHNLEPQHLAELVGRDDFYLPEIDIFSLCHVWATQKLDSEANLQELKILLKDVLKEIRFPLMDPQQLSNIVYTSKLLDDDVFFQLLLFVASGGVQGENSFKSSARQPFTKGKN